MAVSVYAFSSFYCCYVSFIILSLHNTRHGLKFHRCALLCHYEQVIRVLFVSEIEAKRTKETH